MTTITTRDGTEIFYRDWGKGPPVVFSHGWPLTGDAWEDQMMYLAANGFRVIAHDRRGHGRSSQPGEGDHMDQYADDLAELITKLDLKNVMLVGHSTGGGEVTRYVGRHGTARVAKIVLVSAVPPLLLRGEGAPDGIPLEVFDDIRKGVREDRSEYYRQLAHPFFGGNRPGAKISQGVLDGFWLQCMSGSLLSQYECIRAFSETDFRADLARFDKPTLILHGDDDQVVPIANGQRTHSMVKGSTLKVYPGGPHGLAQARKAELSDDLLAFARRPIASVATEAQPRA